MEQSIRISVAEAAIRLEDLVERAREGKEIVLTVAGRASVRLVPIREHRDWEKLKAAVKEILASAAEHATPGPCAAHSQDFLYDEDGLPLGSQPGKRSLEEVRPCRCPK